MKKKEMEEILKNLESRTEWDYILAWESQRSYDNWQIDILKRILDIN